jgi:LuxR family transcriptional regulator of spore coat protein
MTTALHTEPARARLTERERVVLALLGEKDGLTLRQIAAEIYVTRNTLKSQVRSVYRKLGVASRAEAVERARLEGLALPSPRRAPTGAPVGRG